MVPLKIRRPVHGVWSSWWVFVLAGSGFAIGLKNVWQFPYHASQYGGSAFVLVYLCFVFLFGLPLLMTQLLIGRLGRESPVNSIGHITKRLRVSQRWVIVGRLSVLAAFLIFSYYSAIAGWLLAYVARATFGGLHTLSADSAASAFAALIRDPEKQLFWYSLFIVMTVVVVARGVRAGLEPVMRFGVPVLFGLFIATAMYALIVGVVDPGFSRFIVPDFTRLSGIGILTALGDAFYSLGLGVGVFILFGAYLPADAPIAKVAVGVVVADTVAALLGGIIVFPLTMANGAESVSGAGLVFQSLVVVFDSLPGGAVMRALFFVMLVLVAWFSSIALAETVVAWAVERYQVGRVRAAAWVGTAAWVLGIGTILSFNYWKFTFPILGLVKTFGFFDLLQILTSSIMLPLIGGLLAVFGAWVLKPATTREALGLRSPCAFDAWLWLTRLAVPVWAIVVMFNMRLFL